MSEATEVTGEELRVTNEALGVRPLHLKSARAIGEAFRVKRTTVMDWAKQGAPIVIIGGQYQTDYHLLWSWLLQRPESSKK